MPVAVVGAPIVREADGLALSSRNIFLSDDERQAALALSRGLMSAADLVESGERDGSAICRAVRSEAGSSLQLEYAALAGQELVQPLEVLDRPAFLALAAWSGKTRLIDNVHFDQVHPASVDYLADRGTRLIDESTLYGTGGL